MEKINLAIYKTYGGHSLKRGDMWLDSDEMIMNCAEKLNEIVEWINKEESTRII